MPTIVDIYLDRPAVIPEISKKAKALLAYYGASDEAFLDIIFGKAKPEGKLTLELPSVWKLCGIRKRMCRMIVKIRCTSSDLG